VITTAGKMKLAAASAQVNVSNAELALKRARNDLATQVRSAYYNLVVAQETVRITRVVAHFTDEVYRLQTDLLAGGFAASHEPAALRSQVFVVRLAHKQAINNYAYAWKQLVAAIGLPQMPLSAVEGQVDRFIPYYEYDAVLAYVLRNHTDVLTARNNLAGADYNLKLAQVTPVPNLDVMGSMWQETQVAPRMNYHQMSVSIQLPIWDQNKGNIRAAAAARARATEGPHQAELALTSGLAAAYGSYQDNLAAVEYYRLYILPDQVRYYRGVFERRQIDPAFAFNDLVTAQQNLVADVTAYLGILGQLWTSVVNVADFLQTDDFYQLGKPLELPPLPEFDGPHCWPCPHPQPSGIIPMQGQPPTGADAVVRPTETSAANAVTQAPSRAELARAPGPQQPAVEPVLFVSPAGAVPPFTQRATPPKPLGPVQVSSALSAAPDGNQTIGPPGTILTETVLPLPR
jgi:cobalt-zinc-cadmium efflux system outer membrane protein